MQALQFLKSLTTPLEQVRAAAGEADKWSVANNGGVTGSLAGYQNNRRHLLQGFLDSLFGGGSSSSGAIDKYNLGPCNTT